MAKRSSKHTNRVIAIIASLVLAFGLVPVTASAAGEGPDGAGGQAPDAPQAVAAAGPEAPPAPTGKAGDNAAKGDKAVEGGAETSGEKPGEAGDGKVGAPAGGNDENATADGAAVGGKTEAPAEGSGEDVSEVAPVGAGGAEGKGDLAGQADKTGNPEQAAPAAGGGEAADGVQAAQPAAEPVGAKAQFPAFKQSKTVGGVTVTVEAGAGAFPEGARLSVASVPSSRTEAAVASERDENENVAASYTFDVKVLGEDGGELQPAGGRPVRVSFKAAEVADPNLDVSVYHVSGGEAEELPVSESGTTATATSEGFSYYTVEFTYGDLQYVLQGGEEVTLSEVLAVVGLVGEPTDVQVSDSELFSASRESGEWVVTSHQAFSSTEWMRVTIAGRPYEIAVTDEIIGGECGKQGDNLTWELTSSGGYFILTISGTGEMTDYENHAQPPWFDHRLDIRAVAIGQGVTSIGKYAFHGFGTITSVEIPPGVTSIGAFAFGGCVKITSVVIPESVTSIGASAFAGCSSLTSVVIGQGVMSIGNNAFQGCTSLGSVTIPKSVKSVYGQVFFECPKLSHLEYDGTFEEWSNINKVANWASGVPSDMVVVCKFGGTVGPIPEGGGEASARVEVSHNDTQPLATAIATATPNEGYVFVNWTEGGKVVSDKATYSFPAGEHANLTANFKVPLTITARDQNATYNGKTQGEGDTVYGDPAEIAEKFEVEGLRPGNTLESITLDGQGKDAGGYELVPSSAAIGGDAGAGDYAITYVPGTLTIGPAKLTVTTGSATKAYDGEPLTNSDAKITGLAPGETAAVTATGSQTEVGSSPNTYSIDWGSAKAANYTVAEKLGTLTVEAAPAGKGTLTFDLAGGTLDGKTGTITIEANVGDTIKLPKAPTKKGYAFKFWKGSEYAAGAEYKVEGDHAFAAEWAAVHTVTFDANGHGKAPDAQEVEHGKRAKRPANPTADGWTFGGWYKDKACKEVYDFSKPVTEDVTLYAKWTKKSSSGSGTSPKTGDLLAGAFAIALALAVASALTLAASRRRSRG